MENTENFCGKYLASAYVRSQYNDFAQGAIFEPDEALCKGTAFPELFLPALGTEVFYEG